MSKKQAELDPPATLPPTAMLVGVDSMPDTAGSDDWGRQTLFAGLLAMVGAILAAGWVIRRRRTDELGAGGGR